MLSLDERLQKSQRMQVADDNFLLLRGFRAHNKYKAPTNFVEPVWDFEENLRGNMRFYTEI